VAFYETALRFAPDYKLASVRIGGRVFMERSREAMGIRVLKDKTIVLGVSGSIAAYKAVEVASRLVQAGAQVDVVMTEAATKLVTPLTFQAITHRPVVTDLFDPQGELGIDHVALARRANLLLIAPATAHILARMAHGLADDAVTTTFLATKAPVIVAPAMESHMWQHPATQHNVETLRGWGVTVIEPEAGRLASGAVGVGRMAEPPTIVDTVRWVLGRSGALSGYRVVVTAGPTLEPIDPVRYVSNHSSGRMGYALARAARDRGAEVTLISGPTALEQPVGVDFRAVTTAQEMLEAVVDAVRDAHALIMAAAVADYRPAQAAEQKIKKGEEGFSLQLTRNPDILAEVVARYADRTPPLIAIGFAAETENLVENARAKLERKGLDLIVANPVPATFGAEGTQVTLIDREGNVEPWPPLPKEELTERIVDRLVEWLHHASP